MGCCLQGFRWKLRNWFFSSTPVSFKCLQLPRGATAEGEDLRMVLKYEHGYCLPFSRQPWMEASSSEDQSVSLSITLNLTFGIKFYFILHITIFYLHLGLSSTRVRSKRQKSIFIKFMDAIMSPVLTTIRETENIITLSWWSSIITNSQENTGKWIRNISSQRLPSHGIMSHGFEIGLSFLIKPPWKHPPDTPRGMSPWCF